MRRIALLALCGIAGFALVQTASTATTTQLAYNDLNGSVFVSGPTGASPTTAYDASSSVGVITVGVTPDGKSILVEDGTNLDLIPASGGSPAVISGTDGATAGSVSPDGKTVVFATTTGVFTVPIGGGSPTTIVTTPDTAIDSLPAYSPTGTQIAFVRNAFDSNSNETTTIELVSSSGGSLTDLSASPLADASSGGRLSYSPDGKTIAFASDGGIASIPVAGGSQQQLTSDSDGSPVYSPDGKTIYFTRSAFSTNADDNQPSPAHPSSNDVSELWSMNADGSNEAVINEGDCENLVLAAIGSSSTSTSKTTTTSRTTTGGTTTSGGTTTTGTTTTVGTTTTTGTTTTVTPPPKATGSVSEITISIAGDHYRVTWAGKTSARWKVTLRVGKKSVSAIVPKTARSHVFLVKTKGIVSASVTPAS
jgi:Tol biopolymer transport system component